jgi:hypothetical protein
MDEPRQSLITRERIMLLPQKLHRADPFGRRPLEPKAQVGPIILFVHDLKRQARPPLPLDAPQDSPRRRTPKALKVFTQLVPIELAQARWQIRERAAGIVRRSREPVEQIDQEIFLARLFRIRGDKAKRKTPAAHGDVSGALVVIDKPAAADLGRFKPKVDKIIAGGDQEVVRLKKSPDKLTVLGRRVAKRILLRAVIEAVPELADLAASDEGLEVAVDGGRQAAELLTAADPAWP